jgi:hypothetical protein
MPPTRRRRDGAWSRGELDGAAAAGRRCRRARGAAAAAARVERLLLREPLGGLPERRHLGVHRGGAGRQLARHQLQQLPGGGGQGGRRGGLYEVGRARRAERALIGQIKVGVIGMDGGGARGAAST